MADQEQKYELSQKDIEDIFYAGSVLERVLKNSIHPDENPVEKELKAKEAKKKTS